VHICTAQFKVYYPNKVINYIFITKKKENHEIIDPSLIVPNVIDIDGRRTANGKEKKKM
jgi:hypothetical protein